MKFAHYVGSRLDITPISAISAVFLLSLTFPLSPAFAADEINDTTDIVGLNLNMSSDQARSYVLSHYVKAKSTKLVATTSTEYYSQVSPVGFYFEIEPKSIVVPGLSRAGEFIKIISSPNAKDLIGIVRYKGYKKDKFPTRDSVLQALYQKYGEPIVTGGMYRNTYIWVGNADVKGSITGVTYNPGACSMSAIGGGEQFLYELAGAFSANRIASFAPGKQVSNDTSAAFAGVLNNIANNDKYYSKCGVLLHVSLDASEANPDYVSAIMERIVDFDRANAELLPVNDDFWRKAGQAKDAKLKKDSKKPDL